MNMTLAHSVRHKRGCWGWVGHNYGGGLCRCSWGEGGRHEHDICILIEALLLHVFSCHLFRVVKSLKVY
jgi:hypothetical protein